MTLRQFLHTRLGFAIWTLVVALLAFNAGQITNSAQGQAYSRARLTTNLDRINVGQVMKASGVA